MSTADCRVGHLRPRDFYIAQREFLLKMQGHIPYLIGCWFVNESTALTLFGLDHALASHEEDASSDIFRSPYDEHFESISEI